MGEPSRKPPTSLESELASLRIGVCLALLLEDSAGPALAAARMPRAFLQWPEGLRFAQQWLPPPAELGSPLVWFFRACVVLALMGLWTRWSLLGAAAAGFVLLPTAQLVGPTVHNHHLFWFLLLLATAGSSSGASWSLDARLGRVRWSPAAADQARVVVASGRALLGLVYFFPGFWKMQSSGFAWFEPEALVHLFHSKWYQFDLLPWLRVDRFPALLSAGAIAIVLLELSFPLLVLSRRGRTLALALGLSFHVLSAQFLGIAFAPLWLCYGLLVDWKRADAWLRSERWTPHDRRLRARSWSFVRAGRRAPISLAVAIVAIGGFGAQGSRGQQQGFPWACYPTFQWLVPAEQRDVVAVVAGAAPATEYPTPAQARRRTQREWGRVYRLLGMYDDTSTSLREARCVYARWLVESGRLRAPHGASIIDLYEVGRSTKPEEWNEPPRSRRHLARCTVLERNEAAVDERSAEQQRTGGGLTGRRGMSHMAAMPKFITSVLPGLLVGLILGFGLARLGQGDDDDDQAEKNRSIAKACMTEAKKVLLALDRPSRERSGPVRPERPTTSREEAPAADPAARAKRTIETTLKRAKTEKTWTVAHGKMAERMFPRLSPEASAELSKEILDAVESGALKADANAWLPEKK